MSVNIRRCCALDGLKSLPDKSIDCIFTDPPYPAISGGKNGQNAPSGMLANNDGKHFKHNDIRIWDYAHELYRVLKDGTHCYIMSNFINIQPTLHWMKEAGFEAHNLLVWKKNRGTPNRWYMKNAEYILFFRKGPAVEINDCGSATVAEFDIATDRDHPCQKPIDMLRYYIGNSVADNEIVLDPFMGTGSTGLAALSLDCNFIGFEIDPEYYVKACGKLRVMP